MFKILFHCKKKNQGAKLLGKQLTIKHREWQTSE